MSVILTACRRLSDGTNRDTTNPRAKMTTTGWNQSRDLVLLVAALIVVAGAWTFVTIADRVRQGDTQRIDEAVLRAMRDPADSSRPAGPRWLAEAGRDVTGLGGVFVLTLITLAVGGSQALQRRYAALVFLLAAVLGGLALNALLKDYFERPRPMVVPHLSYVSTSSFPSGHSMLSAVVYLTLGALIARLTRRVMIKLYVLTIAMTVTFLVGVSRVYMGVHYPSDVLAGWTAGLTWATLCWMVARYLQRRGAIEQPR